jgi:mRNA-degrading endonuclease RelE of RelBE toxin-antitoxin system
VGKPLELSSRALRDLARLTARERAQVRAALDAPQEDPAPANLDIVPIADKRPWLRLRAGRMRILLRPLGAGYAVERVVNRREFVRAVGRLS